MGLLDSLFPQAPMAIQPGHQLVGRAPAAPAAPVPSAGGPRQILGGLDSDELRNFLQAAGMSLMSGTRQAPLADFGTFYAAASNRSKERRKEEKLEQERNSTIDWLRTKHPDLAEAVSVGLPLSEAFNEGFRRDGEARRAKAGYGGDPTSSMREYNLAKSQGYEGTFMDFLGSSGGGGRSGDSLYGRAPSGYRWGEDGSSLEAIPGGPADKPGSGGGLAGGFEVPSGYMRDPADPSRVMPIAGGPAEKIDGELAARIGLSNEFLNRAPGLREKIQTGAATGPVDVFMGRNNNSSEAAGIYQELEYGTEALVRMLTGAGMNMDEARERARRYLPTYTDDTASLTRKLDDLTSYLSSTIEVAGRGRGGTGRTPAPPAAGGGANRTSSGLSWSVN